VTVWKVGVHEQKLDITLHDVHNHFYRDLVGIAYVRLMYEYVCMSCIYFFYSHVMFLLGPNQGCPLEQPFRY